MKIIHEEKEGEGDGALLLPDGKGGYACFSNKPANDSHYSGWLEFDGSGMYKTLENVWIDGEVDTVKKFPGKYYRRTGDAVERFSASNDNLIYEVNNYDGWVNIDFDFRPVHDFSDKGRNYEIYRKDEALIVKYVKYDERGGKDHEKYIAVTGVGEYNLTDEWHFRNYEYDRGRGSKSVFYVYGTLKVRVFSNAKMVFARGNTEEEALAKAREGFDMPATHAEFDPAETAFRSLQGLRTGEGILAGFPWFFQDWSRDELISLKPYIIAGDHGFAKDVIMKNLERLEKGKLPNKGESSDLASADAAGWLFLRFDELLDELGDGWEEVFSRSELEKAKAKFDAAIDSIRKDRVKDGLVRNGPLETWMDTSAGNDVREGARVEIQALFLRMLRFGDRLAKLLGSKDNYTYMEGKFAESMRNALYRDGRLADGYCDGCPDWTQRPNVFLTHYIYPGLLSLGEWNLVFDHALEKLWLDWGGLASIDKENMLYREEYTGQGNESYHRGDSWYFVNNIAAMCMQDVNRNKYEEKIRRIREASKEEMLYQGFIGHCAEVSSARERRSEGARCQAWSAATLYELLKR